MFLFLYFCEKFNFKYFCRVKRKKSRVDLRNQLNRILNTAQDLRNRNYVRNAEDREKLSRRARQIEDRVSRAIYKQTKYDMNIQRSKSYRNDARKWSEAYRPGNEENAARIADRLVQRQYSRRTYMGLSNG